ncbi:MAG: formylglycine-generating enzyme family protein [Chthoniobacterales bacterium]
MKTPQIIINKKSTNRLALLTLLTLTILTSSKSLAGESNNVNSSLTTLVTVGDPGNCADAQGIGSVNTLYQIGKYEVTAAQYAAFLNAVAWKEDPHGLYHSGMSNDQKVACITRSTNTDGTYSYDLLPERENLPITYISLNNAERYCNWLENGSPRSNQDYELLQQSTEMGAYNFSTDPHGNEIVEANANALVHIPSQDEWVKAAYYKGHSTNAEYSLYATRNNSPPLLFSEGMTAALLTNEANYGNKNSTRLPVITPVTCFSNTISSYEACDMNGNVLEWTITPLPSNDTKTSPLMIARGGSWKSTYSWWGSNELMRITSPQGYDPAEGTNFIGFRIAITIPPLPSVIAKTTPSDGTSDSQIIIKVAKNTLLTDSLLTTEQEDFLLGLCLFWIAATGTATIMISLEITLDFFILDMTWDQIWTTFPKTRRMMIPLNIILGGLMTHSLYLILLKGLSI